MFSLEQRLAARIYPLTHGIAQGPYPEAGHEPVMQSFGITHVLNVSDQPGDIQPGACGIADVRWVSIQDRTPIPQESVERCLQFMHAALSNPEQRVYVHCLAGWNRSATVAWLYLIACGIDGEEAKEAISGRSLDAVAGHPKLVTSSLVSWAVAFGREHLLPHPVPEQLVWAPPLLPAV